MSLDEFECTVRDYQVGYLVSLLEAHTLDEFAFHMTMSRRFRFEPVSRIGDVEILKVYPQAETSARKESASVMPSPTLQGEGGPPEEQKLRIDFLYGLLMLKQGHHDSAFAVFQRLRSNGRLELYATYYAAIAAAFSMHLDVSASLLEQLGETPQAGTFLRQIGYYRGVLQSLRSVVHERSAGEAASLYRSISLGLWDEGFRLQAQEMLNRSLGMDPENFASLVFAALYALQQGDTKGARLYCAHAERVKPRDPLVGSFSRILGRHSPGIAEEHLAACKDFAAMGLSELAIDEALLALRTDPTNTTTLSVLVDLYLAKHRYAPARRILDLLCTLNPHDADARTKLAAVLTRW
jgi:tetratricopeptide (TPR) repeat protein